MAGTTPAAGLEYREFGGFTDEIGALAVGKQLVAVEERSKEVEAISRLCLEPSLSALGDPGGERDLDSAGRHQNSGLCLSATQNSCAGHQN